MPFPRHHLRMIFVFLGISALFGLGLIIYGLRLNSYRHPADYSEARVTLAPTSTASGAEAANAAAPRPQTALDTLAIDGHVFRVDLADTAAKQARGLSGRAKLADDEGMLFIFRIPHAEWFWMYEMNFPIDIVWMRNGVVTGVSPNLPAPQPGEASSSLPTYASPGVIDRALEINAGLAAKYGIKAGDRVEVELR